MSFWEFQACCEGFEKFHAGDGDENGMPPPPTRAEWEAMKAQAPVR